MKRAWINEMITVQKSSLPEGVLKSIRQDLTVETKGFRDFSEVEIFSENGKWIWLPRIYGYRRLKRLGFKFQDDRSTGPDYNMQVNWDLLDQPPYPHDQSILVKTVVEKIKQNGFGGFAIAPTGTGKTILGTYIGALLGGPTLIVVHKSDLIKNWRESITNHVRLNGKSPRIGKIQRNVCNYGPRFPFVIGMAQSLAQKKYPQAVYSAFCTIIYDETQHLPCATVLSVAYKFKAKYSLGVTATLRRKDGTERIFGLVIGDVLYTMVRKGVEGKIFFLSVPFLIQKSRISVGSAISMAKIGTAFANLEYRNAMIIEQVLRAYKEGRKNLVLSHSRQHLANLYAMLPSIVQRRTGFYVGGRTEEQLNHAASKQILLGTFGMAMEGMDVPEIDMLTLVTPVKDVEQAAGRILRKHEDKMRPIILDFVDRHKTLLRWCRNRASYYRREGFKFMTDIPVA